MSSDTYKPITEYPISEYRCGARAGDCVRLRRDMVVCDHKDRPTGEVHRAGEIWTVLRGTAEVQPIIWLRQPEGDAHTWSDDDNFLQTFEIIR